MRKKKIMIFVILMLMMIGFAILTTVLVINGTIKIKNGGTNFLDDVVFTKAETETGTANISVDGKSMTFTTNELVNVGDEFLLNFEVTNKNKSIDGDVEIECGPTNNEEAYEEYITSVINPNHFELKATASQIGTLKVTLNKINFNEDIDIEYGCKIYAYAIGSEGSSNGDPSIVTDNGIAKPKIDEENKLIPVTLANDGTVTVVSEEDEEWYNYREKKWANAIILNDTPSQTYNVGDKVNEDDIESYFVWIPKYKYRLWNVDTVETGDSLKHSIDIIFDIEDTIDEEGISCKTPLVSGESGNCNNGEYMTHPAFITLNANGFWVGKFETGYKGATSKAEAEVNESDSSKIIVKPNVYSWRKSTVYNFFTSAYNYERSLDSHMMKNTEWGAVAYLSHSRYGINKEININNNDQGKTGYSAYSSTDQSTYPGVFGDGGAYNAEYNTSVGYLASTTGNITGIYDMSGGAHEYMASYIDSNYGGSGFTDENIASYNNKYFDIYNKNSNNTTYNNRILGDATGEMSPISPSKDGDGATRVHNMWYRDYSEFIDDANPWFDRGGRYVSGGIAGQFNFRGIISGTTAVSSGSRLVLVG